MMQPEVEPSAVPEPSPDVRIFLDEDLGHGEKVRSRRMRDISPVSGLEMLVEESDMESEDFVSAPPVESLEEVDESDMFVDDEIALLKRCGHVLQEIYALGLDEEIEGEHINVVLRELIDEIDDRILE